MLYKLSSPVLLTATLLITGCGGNSSPPLDDQGVAPVAFGDTISLLEDTSKRETVRSTDSDGDALTFSIKSLPNKGSVEFLDSATGEFEYIPYPNAEGNDSFIFEVTDGKNKASATVSISILGTPDIPEAKDDHPFTVIEGGLLSINAENGILANDSAVDEGDSLSAPTVNQTTQFGNLTLNANGSFEYQHSGSEESIDSFTYTVANNTGSATATVTINITPVNDAPVAVNDGGTNYLIGKNGTLNDTSLNVLTNDSDVDGSSLDAVNASTPTNGSVNLAADGTFSYTHNGSSGAQDSFTYQARDSSGELSNIATVTIIINEPPVAVNDTYTLQGSGWVITGDPRTNDTDAEDNILSIVDLSDPAHGSLAVNENGSFSYTYSQNGATQDSFTYRVSDGFGKSNEATVTLNIHTLPTAVADSYSVITGQQLSVDANAGVRNNDSDTETLKGDLVISEITAPNCVATDGFTLSGNGSFNYTHNGDENCSSSDSFTYKVTDTAGGSATAIVTITILANVPIAGNDTFNVTEAGSISPDFSDGVLKNDSDIQTDRADLVVTLVTGSEPQCAAASSFTLDNDGSFSYTHNGDDSCPSDSFEYDVTNLNEQSSRATATLNITILNDAPEFILNEFGGSNEYEVLGFGVGGSKEDDTGLLRRVKDDEDKPIAGKELKQLIKDAENSGNDEEKSRLEALLAAIPNNPLQLRVIEGPKYGTLKLANITYDGNKNTIRSEDFNYNYNGVGPFNSGDTLDLSKCVNGSPLDVFKNLNSAEIEAIAKVEDTAPFCHLNKDTFKVIAVDSGGKESEASIINIFLNVQPVANDDDFETTMNTSVEIDVFDNDYDRDGAIVPSRVQIISQPNNGGTVVYANEKLTYTPKADFTGTETFTYKARDSRRVHWSTAYLGATSNEATVTITIN